MISADGINATIGFLGGFMVWKNVHQVIKDKAVKGVHWMPSLFFLVWGLWNLYYYPHLGQWLSFFGTMNLTLAEVVWCGLMFKYWKKA